jgi:glucan phosphoethanolaminetransferase (alkaline phosphatase superfamily)
MGAHFPYEGKYPESGTRYKPVMKASNFQKSYPEPGELPHPGDYSKLMRLKFMNSYKNALSWNITSFFQELTTELEANPYVLLYTSDHGQSFHDDGREGYGTHCSITNTDPEEGVVPFFVLTNHSDSLKEFKRAKALNKDKVSHFNIAPTIYSLMGFDLSAYKDREKTIFQSLDKIDQRFLSKYFVRFGSKPIWSSIDMKGRNSFNVWDASD